MSNGNAQTYEQSPAAFAARQRLVSAIMERINRRDLLQHEQRWSTCEGQFATEREKREWHWFFFRNEITDEAA